MTRRIPLEGLRFGRLSVLRHLGLGRYWCRCDCGVEKEVDGQYLRSGEIRSCSCLKKELLGSATRSHGQSKTRTYKIWAGMLQRCTNRNNPNYDCYGGRGISVAPEWSKYETFYSDMGDAPDGATVERVDNNAGYSKQNCVWADRKVQGRNRRNVTLYRGLTIKEWAAKLGVGRSVFYKRFRQHGEALLPTESTGPEWAETVRFDRDD